MTSGRYSYTTAASDRPPKRPHATLTSDDTHPPSAAAQPQQGTQAISFSTPLHDRKSTFQALFSATVPPRDLQAHPSIASASHKTLAWRLPASAPLSSAPPPKRQHVQRSITASFAPAPTSQSGSGAARPALQTGTDDDGEQHGARTVLRALEGTAAVGSCVVARWYGGVMLGPARFAHIERCAREAVAGAAAAAAREVAEQSVEVERARLAGELGERDGAIAALRTLLGEKKAVLGALEGITAASAGGGPGSSPARKTDYGTMSVDRLRVLDQARDKTVAFLLKQIDDVEARIGGWDEAFDALDGGVDGGGGNEKGEAAPVGMKRAGV